MLSELTVFNTAIPGDFDDGNVKFRAIVWICSEVFLVLAILTNLMPRTSFTSLKHRSSIA